MLCLYRCACSKYRYSKPRARYIAHSVCKLMHSMTRKMLGVTASRRWLFFFDSSFSVVWPWVQMSVRNEPKIRGEMFHEKGWKGVKSKAWLLRHFQQDLNVRNSKCCVASPAAPSISIQTVHHCKGTAWLRGAGWVLISVAGGGHNIRLGIV